MAAYATGTLTSAGVGVDTQTITIGNKVYTTQTTLTNVNGNVLLGANAAATLQNLYDAINLTGTAGTQYAAAMTLHDNVKATGVTATTLVVTAKVAGTIGNAIATTETQTNFSWGAAALAGGTGALPAELTSIIAGNQVNAAVAQALHDLTDPLAVA